MSGESDATGPDGSCGGAEGAASFAHDVKNSLTAIRGYAQLLARRLEVVSANERPLFVRGLAVIERECDRVAARVQGSSASALRPCEQGLDRLLNELADLVPAMPGVVALACGAVPSGLRVLAPSQGGQWVFLELMSNASDAMMTAPGVVRIEVRVERDRAHVDVVDEGGGFVAEALRLAGEHGYSTKGSTGVGLFEVRRALEGVGGALSIANRPVGACVTVSFCRQSG